VKKKRDLKWSTLTHNAYSFEQLKTLSDQEILKSSALALWDSFAYVKICLLIKREELTDELLKKGMATFTNNQNRNEEYNKDIKVI